MSFVTAAPEMLATAAQNVANIGTSLSAANATAAASTTSVLAAGADEVSQAIARLFSDYATHYQSLNAQAAAFHHSFVQTLNAAGGAYSSAEAANASAQALEQNLLAVINAPAQALFGRPLIGNGANGTAASPNGGDGGILYGNGGNGFSQTTRSNSRLPTTLNARDQPPAEVSDQRVSGLTGAVHRPELISGGNTEKFTTTAPPLTNHSQPHPRALPQTTRGHPSPRRRPPSGHHSSPGRARTGAASCP